MVRHLESIFFGMALSVLMGCGANLGPGARAALDGFSRPSGTSLSGGDSTSSTLNTANLSFQCRIALANAGQQIVSGQPIGLVITLSGSARSPVRISGHSYTTSPIYVTTTKTNTSGAPRQQTINAVVYDATNAIATCGVTVTVQPA